MGEGAMTRSMFQSMERSLLKTMMSDRGCMYSPNHRVYILWVRGEVGRGEQHERLHEQPHVCL